MEIHFVSIVAFRTALDSLLKVKKGVYASVPAEICRAFQNIPVVALLTVYPKRGPLQKLDLESGELEKLIDAFSVESRAQQVVVHDINNNLEVLRSLG